MYNKIKYESNFRKILWFLEILCLVYILHPINVVAPVTAAFVLFYMILLRPKIIFTPLFYGVSFLTFWLLLSIFVNYNLFLYKRLSSWLWLFEYYMVFCGYLILLRNTDDILKMIRYFTLMTVVFGIFGYLELFFTPQLDWLFQLFRPNGILHAHFGESIRVTATQSWTNPAFAGTLFALGCSLCLAFALHGLKTRQDGVTGIWVLLAIGEAMLVFFTFERTAVLVMIIGVTCVVVYWLMINKRTRRVVLFGCLLCVATVAGLVSLTPAGHSLQRFQSTINIQQQSADSRIVDHSTYGRLMLTYLGWEIMIDNPVFGVGLDNFQFVVQNTNRYSDIFPEVLPGNAEAGDTSSHNVFTHLGSDAGFPGGVAILFISFWSSYILIKYIRSRDGDDTLNYVVSFLLGMAVLLIIIIPFDFSLINKSEGMAYFIIWAFLAAFEKIVIEKKTLR